MKRAEFKRIVRSLMDVFVVPDLALDVVKRRCPCGRKCTPRDLAYVQIGESPPRLVIVERLLKLPRSNVLGVILHEFGHLADMTPNAPGAEQRADDLAELFSSYRISYDSRDIQTIGRGTYPRPIRLHR